VVALVVDGRSNNEIGAAPGTGAKTVETHLARIFGRDGLAFCSELATRALREGGLDLPPDYGHRQRHPSDSRPPGAPVASSGA